MLKGGTNNVVGGSSSSWSRACDTCRSAKCTVYCHADSAYLCSACDARVHGANKVASRHERVRVCEVCERAPAALLCRADAASLCSSCDAEIHSSNRLASRHHRVPVLPFSGVAVIGGEEARGGCRVEEEEAEEGADEKGDDEAEAASWLLPHPVESDDNDESNEFLFCGDERDDEYMELLDCNNNSCGDQNNQLSSVFQDEDDDDDDQEQHQQLQKQSNYGFVPQRNHAADCVVPIQCGGEARAKTQQHSQHLPPGLDFDSPKAGLCYNGFISQIVSVSSLEVGVVPESTTFSEVSTSHPKPPIGTTDLFPPMPMPPHLYRPMDREARVLRYREKKKTRKFDKKIRYASRKAYAEVRPRIKGRFAKRIDFVEARVDDQTLSADTIIEAGYGIVPSFSISR